MKSAVTLAALILWSATLTADDNWPRFRGVNGTGVAADHDGLPTTWTTSENVSWVADVPGWGWSCPIVWDGRVFVTTVVSDQENLKPSKGLYLGQGVREPAKGIHHWMVYCFDLKTGRELWKHEAHTGEPKVPRHPKSTYAAETPTTDGERLYVLFGDLGLYCYDLDGKPLWSQPIQPKKTFLDYGAAASPVVHDGQVLVVYDNLEESWIAAFNAVTGDERWRKPRDETHSWATPLVWENDVRTEIVVPGKKRNRGYSLDGEVLWEFDGRMSNLVIPSPFVAHGLCYIASGYIGDRHRPTFAIRPGATGNIVPDGKFSDSEHIAWYQAQASSYNPTQIVYGDYLYTLYDRGFLTCNDAKTGEEVYSKRRFEPRGSFTASPWAYNGHLFFLSEDGLTYVVKAGPEFEIVGTSDLGELCLSTPSIAGDRLLIRTASAVYCLTEGAQLPQDVAQRRMKKAAGPDIWTAARDGKVDAVARAIESGASLNAKDGNGMTPLMLASLYGRTEVAELLLSRKANLSITSNDGNTALHLAAFLAHPEIVGLLLTHGASADVKNGKGETPTGNVSAPWSDTLAGVYRFIGNLIGEKLDLDRIRKTRPEVLKLLKEHAAKSTEVRADSAIDSKAASAARELLHGAIEKGNVAGGAHLVVRNGRTIHFEVGGKCDIEDGQPFEKDTILRFYSMTKPITSVAAMTLFEQGKFDLDDPVSKFIPEFKETTVLVKDGDGTKTVPAKRQITVRDVFRHTTGYSYGDGNPSPRTYYEKAGMRYRNPAGMYPPRMTIEKAAAALARIPAQHHPGERFTYGFSTDLLGRLIEVWSGLSLAEYLQQAVFAPLQMPDTGFSIPEGKRNRFASCHTFRDGKLAIIDKASASEFNDGFEFLSGGGGLVSTIQDYANFCQMLADEGQFKDRRVLKPETVRLMFTDQLNGVAGGFRFGLGFAIADIKLGTGENQRTAKQYSWGGYASTDFRIVPEEKLFQIVVRQRVPSDHSLAGRLFPIIYRGISNDTALSWNQFRGPTGNGISSAQNLPVEFDEVKNVRWKTPIPDSGWSSPVIWENEIWLTSGSDEKKELRALCVDLESGKVVRNVKVFDMVERKVDPAYKFDSPHLNSPATPTPVVEEARVFVSFGSQGIACLDRKTGNKVWERRDLRIYQPVRQGSSPIVDERNLYVAFDGTDQQFFVALDKTTGETRWKVDRNVQTDWEATLRARGFSAKKGGKPNDNKKSFATATLIEVDGQRQLIAPTAEATISYNPDTGEELWRVLHPGGFNVAARPIYANGLVYVFTSGLTRNLLAIRPDGRGDVTDTHVTWSITRSTPNIPSPVIVDDLLFLVTDNGGIARCLDARTGEEIWKTRLGGNHWASPILNDGKLYFSSKEGQVTVLPASRERPEVLAQNELNGSFIASPAVADSLLVLRSTTHLYCVANGYQRSEEQVAREMKQQSPTVAGNSKQAATPGKTIDWDAVYEKLLKSDPTIRKKVEAGQATKAQVIEFLKLKTGGKSGKGKSKGRAKPGAREGSVNFYAVVIGRLRSKDIELGELELDVDYVLSDASWAKKELVGRRVKLVGVAGPFLDNLLRIKRGETMKVRTGDYNATTKVLGFGYKFQVLERTSPFSPEDFGVPPQEFRGFRGELTGRVVEALGYEVLLEVQTSESAGDSKAKDAESIRGKRIRIAGFYNQHSDAFKELHEGDVIRVGVTHRNAESDALNVTDVLEKVE